MALMARYVFPAPVVTLAIPQHELLIQVLRQSFCQAYSFIVVNAAGILRKKQNVNRLSY